MFIANSLKQFDALFVQQLKCMLSADELGAFILVLANSLQDTLLREALKEDLRNNFTELKQRFEQGALSAPDDDLVVFSQLLESNLDDLPLWRTRTAGDWEVCFNAIRALRPTRSSAEKLSFIFSDFSADKFHFNKPFLKPEILWQGSYRALPLKVLYNKFPFSPYHLLVVVEPEKSSPQYLTEQSHTCIAQLVAEQQNILPGFAIGYNSLAAGASVNHLHFQGFIRAGDFPVEHPHWRHNGGDKVYPLDCLVTDSVRQSWQWVQALHEKNQPYNLLYRGGRYYLLPRVFQGAVELPDWLNGCGWLDLCGVMTLSDETAFEQLSAREIEAGLVKLKVPV